MSGSFTAFISFSKATICCAGFQWVITHDQRRILFVHLIGSHFKHKLRYPSSFNLFPSQYDNAVHYTAYVVDALRRDFMADTQGRSALILYVSDHGVRLPPGCGLDQIPDNELANYSNEEKYYINMSVPLAFWFSPELKLDGSRLSALTRSRDKLIDQRFMLWTLADVMGVTRINGRPVAALSLFSPEADYQPRLNVHGQDIEKQLARGKICKW